MPGAEPLLREALDIRKALLGDRHYETAESLAGLAEVLRLDNKLAEAESLYRQALSIQQEQLGPQNPNGG